MAPAKCSKCRGAALCARFDLAQTEGAVEVGNASRHEAVGGQDLQPLVVPADERRENISRLGASVLLMEGERGLVAMVTVRDQKRISDVAESSLDLVGFRDAPESGLDAVQRRLDVGLPLGDLGRAALVNEEDR